MRRSLALFYCVLAGVVTMGVGPAGARPPAPSISASSNPTPAGHAITVSGRLYGRHAAHATVGLWQRLPWQRRFHRLARTQTDRRAHYAFRLHPDTNRRLYVVGTDRHSRTLQLHVRALVTLTTTSTTPDSSERATLTGEVLPRQAGHYVTIDQRLGTRWVRIARPHLDGHSAFSYTRVFTTGGATVLRAVFAGDDKSASSTSSPLLLDVLAGIHKIQHVVVIMQENRSFDTYFGTFPGADGIPHGVCLANPATSTCVAPFHAPPMRTLAARTAPRPSRRTSTAD
jgi:Phosphoesterase family